MISLLLGSEGLSKTLQQRFLHVSNKCTGSEKLTAALESAAPEKILAEEVSVFY